MEKPRFPVKRRLAFDVSLEKEISQHCIFFSFQSNCPKFSKDTVTLSRDIIRSYPMTSWQCIGIGRKMTKSEQIGYVIYHLEYALIKLLEKIMTTKQLIHPE